jgi:hypothetical protein
VISGEIKRKICGTIILPVALYGYENWSYTGRKECWLRVFENRVLINVFGTKMLEGTRGWEIA